MHIRPFAPIDHNAVADFTADAMLNDEVVRVIWPSRRQQFDRYRTGFLFSLRQKHAMAGVVSFVAETDVGDAGPDSKGVDQVGGIVVGRVTFQRLGKSAVAKAWQRLYPADAVEALLLSVEAKYTRLFRLDQSVDQKANSAFRNAMADGGPLREERFHESWSVANLVVDPRYQGRGVGRMLMEWGIRQAAAERVPVGLTASVTGKHLYQKLGFDVLAEIEWRQGTPPTTFMACFPDQKMKVIS